MSEIPSVNYDNDNPRKFFSYPSINLTGSTANLKELFFSQPPEQFVKDHPKSVLNWKTFPKLKSILFLEVINETDVDDNFKDIVTKEIDVFSLHNTEKIEQFLAKGKENITLDDLLQIDESQLEGVSNELGLQLVELIKEKFREKIIREETAKAQDLLANKENL